MSKVGIRQRDIILVNVTAAAVAVTGDYTNNTDDLPIEVMLVLLLSRIDC